MSIKYKSMNINKISKTNYIGYSTQKTLIPNRKKSTEITNLLWNQGVYKILIIDLYQKKGLKFISYPLLGIMLSISLLLISSSSGYAQSNGPCSNMQTQAGFDYCMKVQSNIEKMKYCTNMVIIGNMNPNGDKHWDAYCGQYD
jgi:hypothetical protein